MVELITDVGATRSEESRLPKYFNSYGHNKSTLQTDGETNDGNTAFCYVGCTVKTTLSSVTYSAADTSKVRYWDYSASL